MHATGRFITAYTTALPGLCSEPDVWSALLPVLFQDPFKARSEHSCEMWLSSSCLSVRPYGKTLFSRADFFKFYIYILFVLKFFRRVPIVVKIQEKVRHVARRREVRPEAEETVEHRAWSITNVGHRRLRDIDCKSPWFGISDYWFTSPF
jgi:hypothetical protein